MWPSYSRTAACHDIIDAKRWRSLGIDEIVKAIELELYEISQHAERERKNDNLLIADLENAVLNEDIIEGYTTDPRGASCLISGKSVDGKPVHLVIGFLPNNYVRIITVYVPDPTKWETDWKTRKERS
jgi:hypothetical protein